MSRSSSIARVAIIAGVVLAVAGGGSVAGSTVPPPTGGGYERLTTEQDVDISTSPSTDPTESTVPDGTSAAATIPLSELEGRILFTRWGGYDDGFFIADADGSDEQRLVPIAPGDVSWLTVGRDGSRASIPAAPSAGGYSVEIVDLADLSTVVLDPPSDPLIGTIGGPFSPDGTQIAYAMDPLNPPGIMVYVGPADDPTAAVQIVPTEPLPVDVGVVFPMDFSPDGGQLLLYVEAPGDTSCVHGSLAIINVDGSGFRSLTPDELDLPCGARWSPDGSTIVFAARDGRLLTISPDGSGLTEVYSEADGWAFQPNWSPDGSRIIFSLNTAADPSIPSPNGIYVINADGSGLTPVIVSDDHKAEAWWVPDVREAGDVAEPTTTDSEAAAETATADSGAATDAVLTLRMGTDDVPVKPATDQIEQFARAVAERSDGSIVIEPVWHAAGDVANGDFDQHVARMVTSGELEMGLIPARAWDTEGVTTLRALQTPFLVTDEALVDEIVSDEDLAGELMSGLDEVGVVGLGLFPEGLRHPFSELIVDDSGELAYGDPLLGPDDYQGAVLGWITSAQTAAMFEALGVTRFDDETDPSLLVGRESSYEFAPPGTATGNVTFFPKVNSLVINADVWAGLSAEQQAILTDAAAETREWAIDHVQSDHDAALQRCANGFGIVLASEEDLAGLAEATAPVVAELREDPATAALIDEITALRDALPPMAIEPVTCDAAPLATTPSVEDTTVASVGESAEFPEGVYRMERTSDELLAHGASPEQAYNLNGAFTMTFDNGSWNGEDPTGNCPGTYTVDAGRVAVVCAIAGPMFEGDWTLDGDQLLFTDVVADGGSPDVSDDPFWEWYWAGPLTRIGDAPSVAATTPSVEDTAVAASVSESEEFPDGVYRAEFTSDELLARGASPEVAFALDGGFTMTFDNGSWSGEDPVGICFGTYEVVAPGRVAVRNPCNPGNPVFFEANWTLDGDQLQFTDVTSEIDTQAFVDAVWAGEPWIRIGDPPSVATTSPSVEETAVATSVADLAFPEGVYRYHLTVEDLLDAGYDQAAANSGAATLELTIADGKARMVGVEDASGRRTDDHFVYCVEGDRFSLGVPADEPGCAGQGEFWSARWEFDEDELRFVDMEVHSTDPRNDIIVPAIFGSHPWLRIGDAPSATDTTVVGVDTSPTES